MTDTTKLTKQEVMKMAKSAGFAVLEMRTSVIVHLTSRHMYRGELLAFNGFDRIPEHLMTFIRYQGKSAVCIRKLD